MKIKLWLLMALLAFCLGAGCSYRLGSRHAPGTQVASSSHYPNTPQAAMLAFVTALDRRDARAAWELLSPSRKATEDIAEIYKLMCTPDFETKSKVVAVVFHGPTEADVEYQSDIAQRNSPHARGSLRFVGRVVRLPGNGWAIDAIDIPIPATEFPEIREWNHEHFRFLAKAMKDAKR